MTTFHRIGVATALLLLALARVALPRIEKEKPMHQATRAFLETLTPDQRARTRLPFEEEERFNWHYVPRERKGLCFKEMNESQRQAAFNLLRACLSQKGYQTVETIRRLEVVLQEIEQGRGPVRDPELYYITVFGEPDEKGVWGLRYEGHHISLQWTVIDGRAIASTPQFLGANPAEVRHGPMQGTRALAPLEDLARALLHSLDTAQRREAILSDTAPPDILTGSQRQAAIQEDKGIAFSALNKAQQEQMMTLIREHASAQPEAIARQRLERLTKAGLETIKFAWMGGTERGQPHYYRIQGKTFLIELDNTQNNANHVHTVWREFQGDFGRDLLAEHYRQVPHTPSDHEE